MDELKQNWMVCCYLSNDIRMKFGFSKCATVEMRHRIFTKIEDIRVPSDKRMKAIEP